MTYLISFPAPKVAEVRHFPSLARAEKAAETIPQGAVFILTTLSEKSLSVIPVPLLTVIHNTALPDQAVQKLRTRADAIRRVLPLIPSMAIMDTTPEDTMATKKSTAKKSSKTAPKAAKKESTGKGPGRDALFAGKTIVRTEKGNGARRNEGSRRTATWNLIPNGATGIKYETLLEKGGHKDDVVILARQGHIESK